MHKPEEILDFFPIPYGKRSVSALGEGKIHETFLIQISSEQGLQSFVLQRLHSQVFPDGAKIMDPFIQVTQWLEKKHTLTLSLIKTKDGDLLHKDSFHHMWRMTRYIENALVGQPRSCPVQAYEAGCLLGLFHKSTVDFPLQNLKDPLLRFHSPFFYYIAFCLLFHI